MSEIKYHVSRKGFLTECRATKRACKLGGGIHYTQEQHDQLAAENSFLIRPNVTSSKKNPEGYYAKAEVAYVESVQRLKRFDKANADAASYEKSLLKEHGMESTNLFTTQEQVRKSLEEALLYAKEVYVEEGVNYSKASFILQDMKRDTTDPTKPITKRKDRLDPDIAAKTKNAVERLNEDSQYATLRKNYQEAVRQDRVASDISQKVARFRTNTIRDNNASGMSNIGEQKEFERAKKWLKAGVAPSATEIATSKVTPDRVSIDDKGRINNVWIERKDGEIERVVGYRAPETPRGSGALITDKGTEVSSWIHYHSYRAEHGGISNVIIGDKNGQKHPASKFDLFMSWDSGD